MDLAAAKYSYKSMDPYRDPEDLTKEEIKALIQTVLLLGSSLEHAEERIKELEKKIKQPKIKPASDSNQESESEEEPEGEPEEKPEPKTRGKSKERKFANFEANETIVLDEFMENLPSDAVFKGYEIKHCIDIQLVTRKIEFKIAEYYSPSLKKSFYAEVPAGYKGQYGPGVKSLIHALSTACNLTRGNMVDFFKALDISISKSTVVNISTSDLAGLTDEHSEAFVTGVNLSPVAHIDDTGARHQGRNCNTTVVTTESVALFHTDESKSRLNAINVLGGAQGLKFLINDEAIEYIKNHRIKEVHTNRVKALGNRIIESEEELELELNKLGLTGKTIQRIVKEGTSLSHLKKYGPQYKALMSDAAKQFYNLIKIHSNCWFHEIKHYKDLTVFSEEAKQELKIVRNSFKVFYKELDRYKAAPTAEEAKELEEKFDLMVSVPVKSIEIARQLEQSKSRKELLLIVLKLSHLPLTNNQAETDLRPEVQKRKISFGTRSDLGKEARDLMMSLKTTCRKLDISFIKFLLDRLQNLNQIPNLAEIIQTRASPVLA